MMATTRNKQVLFHATETLIEKIDEHASQLGISRSQLCYITMLEKYGLEDDARPLTKTELEERFAEELFR